MSIYSQALQVEEADPDCDLVAWMSERYERSDLADEILDLGDQVRRLTEALALAQRGQES